MHLEVLGSQVALGGQEHLDVLGGGIENRGEVGGSHLDDLTARVSNAWEWDGGCEVVEELTIEMF